MSVSLPVQPFGFSAEAMPRPIPTAIARINERLQYPASRKALDQIFEHWPGRLPGGAEIAVQQMVHIKDKLNVERLVEPHWARSPAMASGVAVGPSISTAGSPGIDLTRKKLTRTIPSS